MNTTMLAWMVGPWEIVLILIALAIIVAIIVAVIVAVVAAGKGRTTSTNVPSPSKPDRDSRDVSSQ